LLGTEVSATIPTTRQIITVNSAGAAVPFVWGSLDTTRQAELQPTDPAADLRGSARLDWIRGDQSNEFPNGFDFRARTTLLGDIINSAPAYVGAPTFRYPDTLESAPYSAFRTAHLNRQHMVYVGGNDGMLHAFYSDDDNAAGTGVVEEQFAFVPGSVFKHLHNLPSTAYSHRYYVDGSPVTGDAFTGGAWRTMLVSGLNKGGQGVFALDVTNPAALTESNATNVFRWEFTDANDRDMGYSFSRPSIVKLNDGSWAAVFGNGYNSTVTGGGDVYASTTGNAVLFIVDLWTGALLAKIDTGVGTAASGAAARPNGLSTPVLIDSDGDSDVDYAYAGDLLGNLWKFNLTSTSSGSWAVANAGAALFTAQYGTSPTTLIRQPITSRPNVSRGPRGQGFTIVFGTGKYIETGDNVVGTAAANRQSFYGIHDPNTGLASDIILPGTTGRDNLHQQTITGEVTVTALGTLRTTSNTVPPATARGWYIDFVRPSPLAFQGEMQVTDSLIRNGRVVFTTLVPNTDPCEFGGESWLMEMNLFTGQRPDRTPFDLNNDKIFNDDQAGIPVTGVKTTVGITPKPAPLTDPESNCDYLIFPGTSGGTESRCRDPGPRGFGRQSWRQVN
jgi:type IV pilus assembly protein PilY1